MRELLVHKEEDISKKKLNIVKARLAELKENMKEVIS